MAYHCSGQMRKRKIFGASITKSSVNIVLAFILLLWISNIESSHYYGSHYSQMSRANYSIMIHSQTKKWRNFSPVCYAGYCGPWMEEKFYLHYVSKDLDTERIYLPIFWTSCHIYCDARMKSSLQSFINSLDRRKKYFTVVQLAKGLHHPSLNIKIPIWLDIVFFSAGGLTKGNNAENVVIPLLKNPMKRKNLRKKIVASFVGSLKTHPVRQEIAQKFGEIFQISKNKNWATIMESSFFSFCPRGYGATSFRLGEAIQLLSIPIYVWEDELLLPYTDLIEWSEISIVVHKNNLDETLAVIMQSNATLIMEKLDRISGYFSFDFMHKYIENKLREL